MKPDGPKGTIPLCPHKGCAFKCCDFRQMVHILMYPGERDDALAQGKSLAHLERLGPDGHGGERVRCTAADTATCDGGYKPLDCVSYPFFPEILGASGEPGRSARVTLSKGAGCPIGAHEIPRHEAFVQRIWQELTTRRRNVAAWIRALSHSATDAFDAEPYDAVTRGESATRLIGDEP